MAKTLRIISLFLLLVPEFVLAQNQDQEPASQLTTLMTSFHFDQAVALADSFLQSDSTNTELLFLKSRALTAVFHYKEAITTLLKAQRIDSTNILVLNELMNVYHQSGDFGRAIEICRIIVRLNPENRYFNIQLANLFYSNKDYNRAIQVFLPLYNSDTNDFYSLKQLAFCYDEIKQDDSAKICYKKALRLVPYDPFITGKLANIFLRGGEVNTAYYITAIYLKHDPYNIPILKQNAYCNYLILDYASSVKQFQECLKLGDSTKFTKKYLGLSYYKQEKYDSAAPFFLSAFHSDTTDAEVCFYYGVSECHSHAVDTGLVYLERTLSLLMPSAKFLSSIYSELANAYTVTGNADTAVLFLNKALEKNPDNNTLRFKLAYQYDYYLHKPFQALPWYKEFLKKYPPEPELDPANSIYNNHAVVKNSISEIKGTYLDYAKNRIIEIVGQKNSKGSGFKTQGSP